MVCAHHLLGAPNYLLTYGVMVCGRVLNDRVGERVQERRRINLDENAVGRLLRMEEVIPAMERRSDSFAVVHYRAQNA
jgi:hypothetical protein